MGDMFAHGEIYILEVQDDLTLSARCLCVTSRFSLHWRLFWSKATNGEWPGRHFIGGRQNQLIHRLG
jgi:hypothetical protein